MIKSENKSRSYACFICVYSSQGPQSLDFPCGLFHDAVNSEAYLAINGKEIDSPT
jgi:hypothetical protein